MGQKGKKRWVTYLLVIVWLVGCYIIGQVTHPQATELPAEDTVSASVAETDQSESGGTERDSAETGGISVSFINHQEISTDEIPWGFTAGVILLEDESEAWLLTPGTGLQTELPEDAALRCRIHPWMKDVSDGAILQITGGEQSETLTVGHEWSAISFSPDHPAVRIEALLTENPDGDWVIIQPFQPEKSETDNER